MFYPGSRFAKTPLFNGDTVAPAAGGLDAQGRTAGCGVKPGLQAGEDVHHVSSGVGLPLR